MSTSECAHPELTTVKGSPGRMDTALWIVIIVSWSGFAWLAFSIR